MSVALRYINHHHQQQQHAFAKMLFVIALELNIYCCIISKQF